MKDTSYQNFKKPIKRQCLVQLAASAVALLALIFLFFLPNFSIDMKDVPSNIKTTLPKIENRDDDILNSFDKADDWEDILNAIKKSTTVEFSLYDEVAASFQLFGNNDDTSIVGMAVTPIAIYQVAAGAYLLIAAAGLLIFIIKNILGFLSFDDFALKTYDALKHREKKSRFARGFSPMSFFIVSILFEVLAVFLSKMISQALGTNVVTSYFALMSGLTGVSAVAILFMVVALSGFIVSKYLKNRIMSDIIKSDYADKENAENTNA